MSEDNKERMKELKSLLLKKSFSDINEAEISELIALEQKMSENRVALISLLDAEILNEVEVEEKIEVCFHVFLKGVVKLFGAEKCKAIYDFLPGDTLTFYRPEHKLATESLNVTNEDIEKALRRMRESRPLGMRRVGLLQAGGKTVNLTQKRVFWVTDVGVNENQQNYVEPNREGLIENLRILMERIEKATAPSRVSIRAQQRTKRHLAGTKKILYGIK